MQILQANLPNLRRLFVEARTVAEENEYSRTAVSHYIDGFLVHFYTNINRSSIT